MNPHNGVKGILYRFKFRTRPTTNFTINKTLTNLAPKMVSTQESYGAKMVTLLASLRGLDLDYRS